MKKYKSFLFLGVLLIITGCIGSGDISPIKQGKNNFFPYLTGIDLLGQERKIPQSFEGQLNLIAVAFKREQQKDINTWIEVADQLMEKHKDLKFYELPVIYEMSAAGRLWVNNGMRSGIPDLKARERTITIYTDRDDFLNLMDMKKENIYILLLSSQGEILWRSLGKASINSVQELKIFLENYNDN